MKTLKLSQKIFLLSTIIIAVFGVIMGGIYLRQKQGLYEGKREMVRNSVESAWGVVDHFAKLARDGSLREEEAQHQAKEAIRHTRFDGGNYFWINDLSPSMVVHPIKPELEGRNLSDHVDADGKALFADFVLVARQSGQGYVQYKWSKPGVQKPVAKVSFVKLVPEWGWVLGAGLYLDDIEAELSGVRNRILGTLVGMILLAGGLTWWVSRSINNPMKEVMDVLYRVSHGEFDTELPMGKAVNCSKIKKCGRKDCPAYGKEDHCWVTAGSFAAVKHCPHALKGGDCRTCNLYGARNEMEELAGMIGALKISLKERADLAMAIAQGDLSQEVELSSEKDAFGKALHAMVQGLRSMIGEVSVSSEQIASGSVQVADSSQSLSQGATEQASSLEQISSAIEEMSSQTRQNAANATEANRLSDEAKTAAERGNSQMEEMILAMGEINEAGQNISKIIKVIDEIAFQTNLLALNAAVEAARAGSHGKGFAVVAEEVRNLAARSAKAAKETAELIEGSVGKTANGAQIADRTAEALGAIVGDVAKVSDLVAEIAAASNEQARGITEINQGLSQIDQVTQRTTTTAEESASAAEELSSQASQLRGMLHRFKLQSGEASSSMAQAVVRAESPMQIETKPHGANQSSSPLIALDDQEFGKY